MIKINLIGKKFNNLTVVAEAPNRGRYTAWWVQCKCGEHKVLLGKNIKNGSTKSCGCYRKHRGTLGVRNAKAR